MIVFRAAGFGRRIKTIGWIAWAMVAGVIASAAAAHAEQQALQYDPPVGAHDQLAYHYRIKHAQYGDIGTYVNVIRHLGDEIEVTSEMHIAVNVLGIVFFRQDAQRKEYWRKDRLVSFRGVTTTNGTREEVTGEARGGNFVVTTASGTVIAPGNVHPSNPWSAMVLDSDTIMSTKTGEILKARVSGGDFETVDFDGDARRLRQYQIDDDTQEFVWLDDRGVPQAFRVMQDGSPVDFILTPEG